jgi:hypothetical protein
VAAAEAAPVGVADAAADALAVADLVAIALAADDPVAPADPLGVPADDVAAEVVQAATNTAISEMAVKPGHPRGDAVVFMQRMMGGVRGLFRPVPAGGPGVPVGGTAVSPGRQCSGGFSRRAAG